MSASVGQDQSVAVWEMFVKEAVHGNAVTSPRARHNDTISSVKNRGENTLDSASENGLHQPPDLSMLPISRIDVSKLIGVLRQLEIAAKRHSLRIAFKAKGRIFFVDLAEIVAVQAEGNYVCLRHRPNSYLLRASISVIAEKLKPYGFVRIHRSVIVNTSAVEEIQPLPTGEYRLRVKGGMEYMVTRTYKDNLRDLAQVWVGVERLRG